MKQELFFDGDALTFSVDRKGEGTHIEFGDTRLEISVTELRSGNLRINTPERSLRARVVRDQGRVFVWLDGRTFEFNLPSTDSDSPEGESESKNALHAPMPGTVIKISVSVGDDVTEGQTVAVVEAMKMEHNLRAPRAGKVEQVNAKVGEIVGTEAALVVLADEE